MYSYSQVNGGADLGTNAPTVMNLIKNQGNDTRAHFQKSDVDWRSQPNIAERSNAAHYKITGHTTVFNNVDEAGNTWGATSSEITALKTQLAQGRPVAIGMAVRESFVDSAPTR